MVVIVKDRAENVTCYADMEYLIRREMGDDFANVFREEYGSLENDHESLLDKVQWVWSRFESKHWKTIESRKFLKDIRDEVDEIFELVLKLNKK